MHQVRRTALYASTVLWICAGRHNIATVDCACTFTTALHCTALPDYAIHADTGRRGSIRLNTTIITWIFNYTTRSNHYYVMDDWRTVLLSLDSGNGQLGIFEGFTSNVAVDGTQPASIGVRADCVTESSASFAVRSLLAHGENATADAKRDRATATNLLNYGHIHSGFSQPWAVGAIGPNLVAARPWTTTGDAFGLLARKLNFIVFHRESLLENTDGVVGGGVGAPHQCSLGGRLPAAFYLC